MPTRYLKQGICDSDSINALSDSAECLFYRLLVTADDYGRADGRPLVVKSKCYPIKEAVTVKSIEKCLSELEQHGVIVRYEVDGKPYLQLQKWDNQPRSQVSKFPPSPLGAHPKELREIISEGDLETAICAEIDISGQFAGLRVISQNRQVRKDQSYFDVILTLADSSQLGIELKRTRISKASVEQVVKYQEITNIPFALIGAGMGAGVDISKCRDNDIAVIVYDEAFNAKVVLSNSVISRDFTLLNVCALTVTETETDICTQTSDDVANENLKTVSVAFNAMRWLTDNGVSENHARDWLKVRKAKRAANTETAFALALSEAESIGWTMAQAVEHMAANAWQGFKADWVKGKSPPGGSEKTEPDLVTVANGQAVPRDFLVRVGLMSQ